MKLIENDEFMELIPSECIKANALEKFQAATKLSPVVLFIKGTVDNPGDGYQTRAVEALNEIKCRFTCHDVTDDGDVRELIKEYSKYTSFPQLYINGKFIGGGNFIVDGAKTGAIFDVIPTTEIMLPIRDKIYKLISKGTYMIFLNGTPNYPLCMNSRHMMELIFNHYPWLLKNFEKPELELQHFDLSKEENMGIHLLAATKFGEIP